MQKQYNATALLFLQQSAEWFFFRWGLQIAVNCGKKDVVGWYVIVFVVWTSVCSRELKCQNSLSRSHWHASPPQLREPFNNQPNHSFLRKWCLMSINRLVVILTHKWFKLISLLTVLHFLQLLSLAAIFAFLSTLHLRMNLFFEPPTSSQWKMIDLPGIGSCAICCCINIYSTFSSNHSADF